MLLMRLTEIAYQGLCSGCGSCWRCGLSMPHTVPPLGGRLQLCCLLARQGFLHCPLLNFKQTSAFWYAMHSVNSVFKYVLSDLLIWTSASLSPSRPGRT
jgi:hypothetical protein